MSDNSKNFHCDGMDDGDVDLLKEGVCDEAEDESSQCSEKLRQLEAKNLRSVFFSDAYGNAGTAPLIPINQIPTTYHGQKWKKFATMLLVNVDLYSTIELCEF